MNRVRMIAVAGVLTLGAVIALNSKTMKHEKKSTDPQIGQIFFEKELVMGAEKIEISKGEQQLKIVKDSEGLWMIEGKPPFLARPDKIKDLLSDALEVKAERLIGIKKSQFNSLGLGPESLRLKISKGEKSTVLLNGESRKKGEGQYIAFENEEKSYVSNKAFHLNPEAKNWESKKPFLWKSADVSELELNVLDSENLGIKLQQTENIWTVLSGAQEAESVQAENTIEFLKGILDIRFKKKHSKKDDSDLKTLLHSISMKNKSGVKLKIQIFETKDKEGKRSHKLEISVENAVNGYTRWLESAGRMWTFTIADHLQSAMKKDAKFFLKSESPPVIPETPDK